MNKAIASLALLKANWDTLHQDYIDCFIPFVVTLMQKEERSTIDVNAICESFKIEYGLTIPYHPMIAILDRARRKGYIQKKHSLYSPATRKIAAANFADVAAEQERKYRKVISEFAKYCQEEFDINISESDADAAAHSFFKEYDLDILFIAQSASSMLPEIGASKAHKFLMKNFVTNAYKREPEIFAFIADISVGHIIANTLLCSDYGQFGEELGNCNFYLDIGFLFSVMGIDGPEKKEAYKEFVQLLSTLGAHTLVFRHTYEEYLGILEGCLQWIDSDSFDPVKASGALTYFKDEEFTSSDIEQFVLNVESRLSALSIEVVERPDPSTDQIYQIDEEKLQELIRGVYKSRDFYFDEMEKDATIYRDVKSISAVCKLRQDRKPTKFSDVNHIFVTTNSTLAYASRIFELQEADCTHFFIPATLTDVFVGTVAWIHSPSKVSINEKRLVASCYAALQPSKTLIRKLVDAADRLNKEGEITDEEVVILKESRVARNLLQRETLGDPDRFNDKTAAMILEKIRARIQREEKERYLEKEAELEAKLKQKEREIHLAREGESTAIAEKERIGRHVAALAEQVSKIVGITFYVLSAIVVATVFIFQAFPEILGDKKALNYFLIAIAVILSAVSLLTGFNFKGIRDTIKRKLKEKIISYSREN
jgi:hypothetical protein